MKSEQKLPYLQKAIQVLDTVKVLLRVAVTIDALKAKQYEALSVQLHEVGKMLGGWHNQVVAQQNNKKTPTHTKYGERT